MMIVDSLIVHSEVESAKKEAKARRRVQRTNVRVEEDVGLGLAKEARVSSHDDIQLGWDVLEEAVGEVAAVKRRGDLDSARESDASSSS